MKCIVIANGDIKDYDLHKQYIAEGDCIICADGGSKARPGNGENSW